MFTTLVYKELRAIIKSPKFTATFAVCAVLMLLSVYIGIREYQTLAAQYESALQLDEQQMQERTSWHSFSHKALRKPDPRQIFAAGISYDIGRWSQVSSSNTIRLQNSLYADDPIFAVFRFIDFAFIIQVVLSLLAILFTYDAINGERERGTLRLVFSHAVPRAKFVLAKFAGAWLGLVIPVSVPILLSVLLVLLFKVPLAASDWAGISTIIGVSILFFTFFIALGIFISTLTRRSNVSFLLALVAWIAFVLIIPRAGVLAAGQLVQVPSVAEIEGRRETYAKDRWAQFFQESEKRWTKRQVDDQADDYDAVDDEIMWQRMEEDDAARRVMEKEIDDYAIRLNEDLRRRKAVQERLALLLTRFSPASAYQLAVMSICGTDLALKERYEETMRAYRTPFLGYVEEQAEEAGMSGAIMISFSTEDGMTMSSPREGAAIDLSDMPRYTPPRLSFAAALAPAVVDIGLLGLYSILALGGAFGLFLRYDVR